MDLYGVVGNPIHHSKSPQIHQLFAKQTGQLLVYQPMLAPLDGFGRVLDVFHAQGGKGLNITLPFKQQAYELVGHVSERAKLARAVNTIQFNLDGSRFGDNTDGIGFVRDVTERYAFSIKSKKVLVLGAGGAVRGILGQVLQELPELIVILNRTREAADVLAAEFSSYKRVQVCDRHELAGHHFDLVINGTSASLAGGCLDLPDNILREGALCYDMVYGKSPTPFMRWAEKNHAAIVSDGLGMLVEQAAESFYIWRGVRPVTQSILEML